jgi:serine protease Do
MGATVAACAGASVAVGQSPVVVTPRGWFGVTLSNDGTFDERGTVFFEGYPVVSEVERGSPASRAGVRPGDILMSFNAHDMRDSAFQLRRFLQPGAPFELRLRRNGAVHLVRGTLGTAPDGWQNRVVIDIKPSEAFERRARSPARVPLPAAATQVGSTQRVIVTRTPARRMPVFPFAGGVFPFAGMEVIALNDDIRGILGVKPEGVFVTNVVEGSPARLSGLRGGDVLLQADTVKLLTPVDLVQAITESRGSTMRLRIIRSRKPQTLTLSW